MGLQVWLPCKSSLTNWGLTSTLPVISSSSATIFDVEGKVGYGSLHCDAASYWYITGINLGAEASICCWAKTSISGKMPWVLESDANNKLNLFTSSFYTLNTGDSNNNPFKDINGNNISVFTDNQWHHFVVTFGSSTAKLYIDGVYAGTAVTFRNPTTTNKILKIAGGYNNSHSYDWSGNLEDFRLYDYCLSDKEVEEIARGLILHYKLDSQGVSYGNPNLGKTSANYSNQTIGTPIAAGSWGGDTGTVTFYTSGGYNNLPYKEYHRTATGSGGIYKKTADDIIIESGKTYTMSCWIKASRNFTENAYAFNINRGVGNQYINYGTNIAITTEWQFLSKTFTATDDLAGSYGEMSIIYNDDVVDYYVYYSGFKIEEGTVATQWCDPNATNTTTIYDCSGYRYNGTLNNVSIITNTRRNSYATQFSGITSYIKTNSVGVFAQHAREITLNMWVKNSSWNNGAKGKFFSCTESGGFNVEAGNTGYLRFPIYVCTNAEQTTYAYKYDSNELQVSTLPIDEWVMLTFVYDSTGTRTYINGQLHHTYTNTSYGIHFNLASSRFFLGCEASGMNPSSPYYDGQMSDFRWYYTALTEAQIQELYQASATIDNNGNVYARELVEI